MGRIQVLLPQFLRAHLDELSKTPSHSTRHSEPTDDQITAREYLSYVQHELSSDAPHALLDCVNHLKHAADRQMSSFFHYYGLEELSRHRNLSFPQRLKF